MYTVSGYRIEIRPQQHCGIVWLNGPNAIESLMQSTADVAAHPDWSADFDIIVAIGTDSDLNDVTLDKLVSYQKFISEWSAQHRNLPPSQAAIVCADELKRVIVELWLAQQESRARNIGPAGACGERIRYLEERGAHSFQRVARREDQQRRRELHGSWEPSGATASSTT